MKIFAISDLHLSNLVNKPMDIFGDKWKGHWDKIKLDWQEKVTEEDIVLIAGDISWAMSLKNACSDLEDIDQLKGKKVIIRGNHDYWWESLSKLQALPYESITFIQNNSIKFGDYIICGTRGWMVPENNQDQLPNDKKIFDREIIRLKLTLDSAKLMQQNNEKIIVMMHYPPFNSKFADSEFTSIINDYCVDKVVYGHLHGEKVRYQFVVDKKGIKYLLTSCDLLNNELLEID
ncbi:MAG: metallophosphoesterase [Clostridia bacterium]